MMRFAGKVLFPTAAWLLLDEGVLPGTGAALPALRVEI